MRSSRSVNNAGGAACLARALLLIGAVLTASAVWPQDGTGRTPEQLLPEAPPPPRILDEERARRGNTGAERATGDASAAGRARGEASDAGSATGHAADADRGGEVAAAQGGAEAREGAGGAAPPIADTGLAPALAAPRSDASDDLDEVLVVGTVMRLPDLGSSLRAQREAERDAGRISATFLPLYDPEAERAGFDDPLFRNRELERVGFIELFRIRFGKRSTK